MDDPTLIALGANLPSVAGAAATLEAGLAALAARGLATARRSAWYWTPAYPPGSGPDYVNGAAVLATGLAPEAVLEVLHEVEGELGRTRGRRWAARACDLDLLAHGGAVRPDAATARAWIELSPARHPAETPATLILPHPRMQERGFVLVPLAEVAPDWVHPLLGRSVREMLAALPPQDLGGIVRL